VVIEVRLHFYLFCNNMKRLRMGHKFSLPSFFVTMAFTQYLHICLSFKSYTYMLYLSMMATHLHPILFKFKESCHMWVFYDSSLRIFFLGEQNFMFILHEKYDFNTHKDLLWKRKS
jgi:hypothetical protein